MDRLKNRFIVAMEIGFENEATGINYNNLVRELENRLGYKLNVNAECTFMQWFLENYSTPSKPLDRNIYNRYKYCVDFVKRKHGKKYAEETNQQIDNYKRKILDINTFLNGDASKKYLDYIELVEARQSSKQANKKANTSIWIAIMAILLSIIFSIIGIVNKDRQPYEVKVINQKEPISKTLLDSLQYELQKADALINIYEEDLFSSKSNNSIIEN